MESEALRQAWKGRFLGTVSRVRKSPGVLSGALVARATELGAQEAMVRKGDWSSEESQETEKQEEGSGPATRGTRNVKPPDPPQGTSPQF